MVSHNMTSQHSISRAHARRKYTVRVFHDGSRYCFKLEFRDTPYEGKLSEEFDSEDEAISAADDLACRIIDGQV